MKQKILFVITRLSPGGAEEVVINQMNHLSKDEFDISLLTLSREVDDTNTLFSLLELDLDKRKLILFPHWYSIQSWRALVRWLRQEKFDILYSHLWFASFISRIAGKIAHVPRLIIVEHNVYATRTWWEKKVNSFLGRVTFKIVAVSQAVKEYLIEEEGISGNKIQVVYNGIDLEKYNPERVTSTLRTELGFSTQDFLVLSLGRVSKQKGYDRLVATARLLEQQETQRKVHFLIAGRDDGGNWDTIAAGKPKNVHFLGYRTDIPELLATSDVFFMPSWWEGFGLSLVEGMAMGKPVVVSDLPTFHELMGGEMCGFFGNTPKEFTEAILRLSEDKEMYQKFQVVARERARSFSLGKNIANISGVFLNK